VRTVHVDAARLHRWVAGFAARHGLAAVVATPEGILVQGEDGAAAAARAALGSWEPPLLDGSDLVAALAAHALTERRVAVVLLRRGGYACAMLVGRRIEASKVGSRYVQGRTAAGGWSQQRFARRRDRQTDELVGACAEVARRLLLPALPADAVVTGGDRRLLERVLADPGLTALRALPRGPHLDVGDPREAVLREVADRVHSVRIDLAEPDRGPEAEGSAGSRDPAPQKAARTRKADLDTRSEFRRRAPVQPAQ
jgi:hypothetical protein